MTILHSCCCWRSVRQGSYACGIYSGIYCAINLIHSSCILNEELQYLRNASNNSFIDHGTTTDTSLIFTSLAVGLSSTGVVAALLLLFALYRNVKYLLVPWIINTMLFIFNDIAYIIYSLIEHALRWNPFAAILITVDFFINALNIYALLCVISQYQEYKAGRGRANGEGHNRMNAVQYNSHPTGTSFISCRKTVTYQETKPTPTQSPSGTNPGLPEEQSPNVNKIPRKSVKFPSDQNGTQHLVDPWTIDVKSPMLKKGADTTPLIVDLALERSVQSNV